MFHPNRPYIALGGSDLEAQAIEVSRKRFSRFTIGNIMGTDMVPIRVIELLEDVDRSGYDSVEEEEVRVLHIRHHKWEEVMDGCGYDSVEEELEVLPMVDIRNKWQEVAVDVLLAMFCLLPGIGVLFWFLLFRKYYCLARPQPPREGRGRECLIFLIVNDLKEKIAPFLFWCIVLLNPLLRVNTIWIQFQALRGGTLDLRSILGFWELVLLTDAIWMGSSLGWLILRSQRDQIVQSVCVHKKRHKQILMENARARDLLGKLFDLFPEQFNEHTGNDKKNSVPLCSLPGCVLSASTAVMLLLMCAIHLSSKATNFIELRCAFLKLEHHEQECKDLAVELQIGPLGSFSVPKNWVFWFSSIYAIYLATVNWRFLIRGVLITTSVHMQENCRQLLLFTALTRSEEWNSRWSEQNRADLLKIVGGSFDGETTCPTTSAASSSSEDEEDGFKQRLRQAIEDDQSAKKHELDLGQEEDVKAWWLLRQYIQIDFVDEVVVAECCGVIVMILVFEFFLVAMMDWLRNHQISCALVLVVVLTLALLFAMYELFKACVSINTLWERDDHTLIDAIVTSAMQGQSELKGLLESLQRKVLLSDARQELFGIRVTVTLRNAWVLSLVIWLLSTLWEVAKPSMEKADLESIENALANFANASNYRIARAGG